MQRDNNFSNPIVDVILSIGFADYNPFTKNEIRGRYSYVLDYFDEIPSDQMTIGDYIESLDRIAEDLYAQHFDSDDYKKYFCCEIMADESFYKLRLLILMDEYDEDLIDVSIEFYDNEDEDD
jgi:hypothetical protein